MFANCTFREINDQTSCYCGLGLENHQKCLKLLKQIQRDSLSENIRHFLDVPSLKMMHFNYPFFFFKFVENFHSRKFSSFSFYRVIKNSLGAILLLILATCWDE